MSEEIRIINYNELLKDLEESKEDCHLLLGNGFNNSLSIHTDYKSIFEKMQEEEAIYTGIKEEVEKKGYDIEALIGELKDAIKSDNEKTNKFLGGYIERKVKFDFMKVNLFYCEGKNK